jgi:hypothetical protein
MFSRIVRSSKTRSLVALLALALVPSPLFMAWFLSRPRPAEASPEPARSPVSLTDVAPRQPALPRIAQDEGKPSLRRLALPAPPPTSPEPLEIEDRDWWIERFEAQGRSRAEALTALAELENPAPPVPPVVVPNLTPPLGNPFVRPPLRVDPRRGAR